MALRSRRFHHAALAAAAACSLLVASAVAPAAENDLGLELHRVGIGSFPAIEVSLTLLDPSGRALKGLERRNFRIFEETRPAEIGSVAIDETPIVASICVDTSGSMKGALDSVKRAAGLFIRLLDEGDQAELIAFADEPRILSPRTGSKPVLLGRLQTLTPFGATALYDAMWRGLLDLRGVPGRRVLLVLTDGQDQNADGTALLSRRSLEQVLTLARGEGVPIFTIGLGKRVLRDELARIASETRGRAYFAPRPSDLQQIYLEIAANLKSQVLITYRSPEPRHDGRWRTVEVRASAGDRTGLAQERFRAPGKYILELSGQGFDRLREAELARETPSVTLRNLDLASFLEGKPSELLQWMQEYFSRATEAAAE